MHSLFCLWKVYIAPSKALVQEKLRDWNQKFGSWGISCLELTGDNDGYNVRNLQEADIILTTPEVGDQGLFTVLNMETCPDFMVILQILNFFVQLDIYVIVYPIRHILFEPSPSPMQFSLN